MGMDVVGKKKDSYFRNNVWWWRPLWNYCKAVAPQICDKVEHGQTNDGDGLNAEDSAALAEMLKSHIANGHTQQYAQQYKAWQDSLPREKCELCNATGIRTDKVGVDSQMPNKELSIEQAKKLGRTQGWCNGCDGKGDKAHWQSHYPFSVDNVQEFSEFLEGCGGFEIW